jgi:hypothetical protein
LTTPIFNGEDKIGVYGAQFNLDSLFENVIDPMLTEDDGITYWVYNAEDLTEMIHTNAQVPTD